MPKQQNVALTSTKIWDTKHVGFAPTGKNSKINGPVFEGNEWRFDELNAQSNTHKVTNHYH